MTLIKLDNSQMKDILYTKRIHIIQKARTPLQVQIQMINNELIDEQIFTFYDETDTNNPSSPYYTNEERYRADIGQANLLATYQDLDRLLEKNNLITKTHIARLEQYNASKSIGDAITNIEVERINKNIKYVEETLKQAELDIKLYRELVEKLPNTTSRKNIIESSISSGESPKGRKYTYKDLNKLSRELERYRDNHTRYANARLTDEQSQRDGTGNVGFKKVWIWSRLENTRHELMGDEEVGLYETFEVINEQNGDIDYLRFPHDVENDRHNCSNICNCGCSYEIKPKI